MFVLCAWLGSAQTASPMAKVALTLIAILFFVPPALLLYNGIQGKNRKLILWIRGICLGCLILTPLFFCLFLVSINAPGLSYLFFLLLNIFSAPLFCGKSVWLLILFLWAALLFATFLKPQTPPKMKK